MTVDTWLLHDTPSKRFPIYTRSNAAEVMGAPVSPLGWSYVWREAFGPGTVRGYVDFGGFDADEFDGPEDVYGIFGGYFYLNISVMFVEMERMMPGGAARMAAMFDSGPGMPPHIAEDWHANAACGARVAANVGRFMAGEVHPDLDVLHDAAIALRAGRPDLASISPAEIIGRLRSITPLLDRAGCIHVQIGQAGMIAMGQLAELLAAVGRAGDVARLGTGIGDVESADIARGLWTISRLVRGSPALKAAFAPGIDGVLGRITDLRFHDLFRHFLYEHGARATNEWDLIYDTYETAPQTALALIDAMAKQGDEADPEAALNRNAALRRECLADIRAQFPGQADAIAAAAAALATWFVARERSKNMCVRLVHEARMGCEALAAQGIAAGTLDDRRQFYMLLSNELDVWANDPAAFTDTLRRRLADYDALDQIEPPFFVNGECPPIAEWPQRSVRDIAAAADGDRLTGVACSPGQVTGRARIILDPSDPGALEPDEILVTTNTNPSWTPLFLVAGAVVTEFGLFNSHASIVSRELGIPCVASVDGATDRIKDGMLVTVDGAAGTVEILAGAV
jgi:pyruvate,water dikinase